MNKLIEDTFVDALLKHVLDGNKGSNILGALLTAVIAAHVDWSKISLKTPEGATELAKITGAAVLALYAYSVGKKGQ